MDDRQPVLHRDVERAHDLLGGERIPGAALDGGIVGADDALRGPRRRRCRRSCSPRAIRRHRPCWRRARRVRGTACRGRAASRSARAAASCPGRASRSRSRCGRVCARRLLLVAKLRERAGDCARRWRGTRRSTSLIVDWILRIGQAFRRWARVRRRSRPCRKSRRRRAAARPDIPSRGATSVICNFMLSMVTSVSPRATVARRALVDLERRLPGIGART